MAKRYYLSEEDRRKLKQELSGRKSPARRGLKKTIANENGAVFVKISGTATQEAQNRWRYSGTVVSARIDPGGSIVWEPSDPPVGVQYLYNGCEAFNIPDPSIRGNGVDSGGSGYPTQFDLQPIRGAPVVLAFPARLPSEDPGDVGGSRRVYFFSQPNADDGVCE